MLGRVWIYVHTVVYVLYVIYKYIYIVQMKLGEIGDNRAETWRYDPSKIINTVSP
jgi:hypothetical protein